MDIKKAVFAHLSERRELININALSVICGYSNSTLHRQLAKFKRGEEFAFNADFCPLFLYAAWLGLHIEGVTIDLNTHAVENLISKGKRRGETESLQRPDFAYLSWGEEMEDGLPRPKKVTLANTSMEVFNFFADIPEPHAVIPEVA